MWDGIGVALWYEIHLLPPAPWISTGSRLLPPSSPIPLGIPPPPSLASPLHHSRQNRLPDSANQFIRMMYVIMFWFHPTKYNGLFFFLPSMINVITVIKEDNWKGSAASALKEEYKLVSASEDGISHCLSTPSINVNAPQLNNANGILENQPVSTKIKGLQRKSGSPALFCRKFQQ